MSNRQTDVMPNRHQYQPQQPEQQPEGDNTKQFRRSEARWNHWLVLLTGIAIVFGTVCGVVKAYVLTPFVLDAHQKVLDAHSVSIVELEKKDGDNGNRLIRIEDTVDGLKSRMGSVETKLDAMQQMLERIEMRSGSRTGYLSTNLPVQRYGFPNTGGTR